MRRLPFTLGDRSINYFSSAVGVSNHVISIGCALHLAKELSYRPVVFWLRHEVLGRANLGDLFDTTDLPFELVEGIEAKAMRAAMGGHLPGANFLDKAVFRLLRRAYRMKKGNVLQFETREDTARFREKVALSLKIDRRHVLLQNKRFRYGCDLSWLKPIPQINSQIIELKKRFAPHTVGVHLRGTDSSHRVVLGVAIEKMIARMRAEVELNPDVKFFFASDGDKRGEAIETLFEDRLIRHPEHAPRRTMAGQQDAVVDLFGLAATSRIIGMRHSTFSTLAALTGNKPLLRIK